ncbi:Cytochrome B561 [Liberibacter crescens BT-1]|uniref:Cytochrome B561 n=1 Tax=Liberibacter crescens (strain BT-1) TaxID=1215343 RepID=L0ET95_LIBCB|nr:cytochrome b/b6 domain-containing protein [Liberibacter crescens]AGA64759.1 Cytochrome B561 [Liberibacter crescens BT-1]AMC12833.1 cytochrome B561 [Liberibacter crescens]
MKDLLKNKLRHSKPTVFFHWAVFLLILIAYLAINLRGLKGTERRFFFMQLHFLAGSLVLILSLLRIGWRIIDRYPPALSRKKFFLLASRIVHAALYVFILVQPLLGIMMINMAGHPVTLSWLNISYTLFGKNEVWGHDVHNMHVWLGTIFYYVIGLHILVALWHQFVKKDSLLKRMWF